MYNEKNFNPQIILAYHYSASSFYTLSPSAFTSAPIWFARLLIITIALNVVSNIFFASIVIAQNTNSNADKKILRKIIISSKNNFFTEKTNILHVQSLSKLDLQNRGIISIREALLLFPSVTPYQHAGQDYIQFQGLSGQYLIITIDGIPVTGRISQSLPFNQLAFANIERIELLKGAATSLYGNGAVGGIINIVTKGNNQTKNNIYPHASFHFDNYYFLNGKYWANAAWQHKINSILYTLQGSYTWDDGFFEDERIGRFLVPNYKLPNINQFDLTSSLSQRLDKNTWWFKANFSQNQLSRSSQAAVIQGEHNLDTKASTSLLWQNALNKNLSLQAHTSYKHFQHDITFYSVFNQEETSQEKQSYNDLETESTIHYQPIDGLSFKLGANYLIENAYLDSAGSTNLLRNNTALFLHSEWSPFIGSRLNAQIDDAKNSLDNKNKVVEPSSKVDILILSLGARSTINSDFGLSFNPELGWRYSPFDFFSWRIHYGRGYRAPTFKDQHYYWIHPQPVNFLIKGNPNLKPETTDSLQNSLHFYFSRLLIITLSSYAHLITDKIAYGEQTAGSGIFRGRTYNGIRQSTNITQAYRLGSDIEFKGSNKFFRYQTSFSYNDSKDYDKNTETFVDAEFSIRYHAKIFLGFILPHARTLLGITSQWNAGHVINRETQETIGDTYNIDLNVNQPLTFVYENLALYGGVKNLFDQKTDFLNRQEGIKFYVGLRAGFDK